eukprot:TRINITY_DN2273_c0_g7_i1.p2 TRINITY_DN2273_c0_g7~~TRINITY_DN2273_c0_g7_i1.p2  ORF type:complete len:214 (+),score=45.16 TRINITY_DN2273_c0_g7_i1:129-770(+)
MEWSCGSCTFANSGPAVACQMCGTAQQIERTQSQTVAEVVGVSQQIARAAIESAHGNVDLAVANLLVGPESQEAPVCAMARTPSMELAELGGVTIQMARELLVRVDGDSEKARRQILSAFESAAQEQQPSVPEWIQNMRPIEVDRVEAEIECDICADEVVASNTMWLHQCGHHYCKTCLQHYIQTEMQDAKTLISCPSPDCPVTTMRCHCRTD